MNAAPEKLYNYKWWPTIRPYQQSGAHWLHQRPNGWRGGLLADGLGTGKSRTTLAAARIRAEKGDLDAPLIILTTSIARTDWRREANAFWPEAQVFLPGNKSGSAPRKGESPEQFEERLEGAWRKALSTHTPEKPVVIVQNYDSLVSMDRLYDELERQNILLDAVAIDEAHNFQRATSQLSIKGRMFVAKARTAMLITATPISNRPYSLYNLLDLCGPGRFGSQGQFFNRYFLMHATVGNYGFDVGELLEKDKLNADMEPIFLQRTSTEAFGKGMPPRIRSLKRVEAPNAIRISPAKAMRAGEGTRLDSMLRECVEYKLQAAVSMVQEFAAPVVLYTYQRKDAEKLAAMLKKAKIPTTLAHGDLPVRKRAEVIEEWKNGATLALVCTMDAVRESATLTRADIMIFCDLTWLVSRQLQCEGRIDPARQKENERRPARYFYLVIDGGPDEVVAEALISKIRDMSGVGSADASTQTDSFGEFLAPLEKELAASEKLSETQLLADLVQRMETRANRLADLGFL